MEKTMREIVNEDLASSGESKLSYTNNMWMHYLPEGEMPLANYRDMNNEILDEESLDSGSSYREILEAMCEGDEHGLEFQLSRLSQNRLSQSNEEFYQNLDEAVEPVVGIPSGQFRQRVYNWKLPKVADFNYSNEPLNKEIGGNLFDLLIYLREKHGYGDSDLTG